MRPKSGSDRSHPERSWVPEKSACSWSSYQLHHFPNFSLPEKKMSSSCLLNLFVRVIVSVCLCVCTYICMSVCQYVHLWSIRPHLSCCCQLRLFTLCSGNYYFFQPPVCNLLVLFNLGTCPLVYFLVNFANQLSLHPLPLLVTCQSNHQLDLNPSLDIFSPIESTWCNRWLIVSRQENSIHSLSIFNICW